MGYQPYSIRHCYQPCGWGQWWRPWRGGVPGNGPAETVTLDRLSHGWISHQALQGQAFSTLASFLLAHSRVTGARPATEVAWQETGTEVLLPLPRL